MAEQALAWTEVDSSNVKSVAYDEPTSTLCVEFRNGGVYSYEGVDQDTYTSLSTAPSVGRYLDMVVKGMYPYQKWFGRTELEMHLHTL